jgi:LysR family transcriptional regulator, hydrogen peroxide-inducible genes activator
MAISGSGVQSLTLRQLQYLVAVADTLSFRKAAERCHVSQPSLSAQVAQLEEALGVRVFERDRRHVLLTEPGREMVERARRLLVDADDLVEAARCAADPLTGTLRIGVIPTISPYLLPGLSRRLRRKFRRLNVVWVEDKTAVLTKSLRAGALEAALVALEADLGEVDSEVVARDPFALVALPSHPLVRSRSAATPKELAGARVLLLDDGHCFRDQALALCSLAKAHELGFRATSLSTLVQMVADGAGVTLLPALAVSTEARRARLRVRAFSEPAPHRTLALVWRKRSPLAAALHEVAVVAREAYAERRPQRSRRR